VELKARSRNVVVAKRLCPTRLGGRRRACPQTPSGPGFLAALSRPFPPPQPAVLLRSSVNRKAERTLSHPDPRPKGNSPGSNLLDVVIANHIYLAEARGAARYHQAVLATKTS